MMAPAEFPAKEEDSSEDLNDAAFSSRGCCSFNLPSFRSRQSGNWERIYSSAREDEAIDRGWWERRADALRRARELSKLVAGPKWKTFIRRFNRSGGRTRSAKFQYDPLSYSLNFERSEAPPLFRDFSSRYSAIPARKVQV